MKRTTIKEVYKILVEQASKLVARRHMRMAFAESATAGKLAFAFSRTEYSGEVLKGGIVCYDACIKEDILGIPPDLVATYTPESAEVTRELAGRVKELMKAEIGIAVTGLLTSGGSEGPGKPVGTIFYCIIVSNHFHEYRHVFRGNPDEIIDQTIDEIALSLIRILSA